MSPRRSVTAFFSFDFSYESLTTAKDAAAEVLPASSIDFAMFAGCAGWESFGNEEPGGSSPRDGDGKTRSVFMNEALPKTWF